MKHHTQEKMVRGLGRCKVAGWEEQGDILPKNLGEIRNGLRDKKSACAHLERKQGEMSLTSPEWYGSIVFEQMGAMHVKSPQSGERGIIQSKPIRPLKKPDVQNKGQANQLMEHESQRTKGDEHKQSDISKPPLEVNEKERRTRQTKGNISKGGKSTER